MFIRCSTDGVSQWLGLVLLCGFSVGCSRIGSRGGPLRFTWSVWLPCAAEWRCAYEHSQYADNHAHEITTRPIMIELTTRELSRRTSVRRPSDSRTGNIIWAVSWRRHGPSDEGVSSVYPSHGSTPGKCRVRFL